MKWTGDARRRVCARADTTTAYARTKDVRCAVAFGFELAQ